MSLQSDPAAALEGHARPALSWSAVSAGVATALAVALTLDLLGAAFGYVLMPPGLATPGSIMAFTPAAGGWSLAAEAAALALGGYVAGRLRPHWRGVHADEAHFRDTAHGLLTWATATVIGSVLTALVFARYAASLSPPSPGATSQVLLAAMGALGGGDAQAAAAAQRMGHIAAQASLFGALGLLLGAFSAAVAAALGGLQRDAAAARDLA